MRRYNLLKANFLKAICLFSGCSENCANCSIFGPGKCDVCSAGYGPTLGQACGGRGFFSMQDIIVVSRVLFKQDKNFDVIDCLESKLDCA